jgi:hypothetical protein
MKVVDCWLGECCFFLDYCFLCFLRRLVLRLSRYVYSSLSIPNSFFHALLRLPTAPFLLCILLLSLSTPRGMTESIITPAISLILSPLPALLLFLINLDILPKGSLPSVITADKFLFKGTEGSNSVRTLWAAANPGLNIDCRIMRCELQGTCEEMRRSG